MSKLRVKMPVSERAKQFSPFSPLKGLRQALAKKERLRVIVKKREVSEDMAEENDRALHMARPGMMADAVYFNNGEYIRRRGLVAKIDAERRVIRIVETEIDFDDLFEITVEERK